MIALITFGGRSEIRLGGCLGLPTPGSRARRYSGRGPLHGCDAGGPCRVRPL